MQTILITGANGFLGSHVLEETRPDNRDAIRRLGYKPQVHWKDAIRVQIEEMKIRQKTPMRMAVPG